jgi:iron complex transport system ATP-binding protein
VVEQSSRLVFSIRAGDYVLQGRYPHGHSLWYETDEDIAIAANALAEAGATDLRDRWMHDLSAGERQRVQLARALAQQPLLLLVDEPTAHMSVGAQCELLRTLRRLAQESRYTIIVVTHELSLAAEFADQVVLLHRGKCLRVGPPAAVYQRELLEQVFDVPLEIELAPSGRPSIRVMASRD